MFTELAPLLRKGDTLVITVARNTDTTFRATVTPRLFTLDGEHGEDRKALNQPVVLDGTAAELDSPEFAASLNRFTTSTLGLRQTIDDVEAAHKAAKATKLNPKPSRATTPVITKLEEPEVETETAPEPVAPAKPVEATASLI